MSGRILWAILRKDLLSLRWLVLLSLLLFAGDVVLVRLELMPVWDLFRIPLLALSGTVLIFTVFQLDSPVSLVDDWLCRPVPRAELIAAKLLLLAGVFYLSRAAVTWVTDLWLGSSFTEALLDALLIQELSAILLHAFLVLPLVLMIAVVTHSVVQGVGVLIALFVGVFAIPTPFVQPPSPLRPGIGEALSAAGFGWLEAAPAKMVILLFTVAVFWLVFWRRRILAARVTVAVAASVTVLLVLLPGFLLPWPAVFDLQTRVAGVSGLDAEIPERIGLRSSRACFPSTRVGSLESDAAFGVARQASGLSIWSDEDLRDSGPDALTFLTQTAVTGLPPDWRVKLNYVAADYSSAAAPARYSLRPARYITDGEGAEALSHAWVLPQRAVESLASDASASLRLTYYLTLLEPRHFQLPVDGRRHALPGLGYCDARREATTSQIQVDCLTIQGRPAQVSAELDRIPATRVLGGVDFAPRWMGWTSARRVKLTIGSARLSDSNQIRVTAWNVAGYLRKSSSTPGVLGAELATCPLPGVDGSQFQKSRWRDAAPHEVQSIAVDAGLQLEVLDFGGAGSPILLVPGLGATAHSYDELAPLLAKNHRVVALTRRGTGSSSKTDHGFDTPRLARDILQVMDAMQLQKVLLVGHSIAGDELTWLGGHHPERFRGLVYLDAAYDRSGDPAHPRSQRLRELARRLPPEPPLPPAALVDVEAMNTLLRERGHVRLPEGELIAFHRVNQPFLAGTPAIDARTQQAISAAKERPDYARVTVPALAIYAIPDPRAPLPAWYDARDPELQAALAERARLSQALQRESIEQFRKGMTQGQVLELPNSTHYLIQSNPQEVLQAIERFADQL